MPHNDDNNGAPSPDTIERGHEFETTNVRGVVIFGVVLLVSVAGTLIVLVGLYNWFTAAREPAPPSRFADIERVPPEPRLQQEPAADMTLFFRRESAWLESYGWANEEQSAVRIPIEEAMEHIAEVGLPYDTTTARLDDTYRIISETGYLIERYGPRPPSAPPVRGGSPEPFVPGPEILRELGLPGLQFPNWERRAAEQDVGEDENQP